MSPRTHRSVRTERTAHAIAWLAIALLAIASPAAALEKTSYRVDGLSKKAEIVVDRWGIPHIYAQTEDDLFFAQGFNAARDRLWQLDLWRRQGEGKLSESFGPRFVAQDRAARLFLYRGDLEKEFASYHPHGKAILTAFTNGINAYVDLVTARPDLLPIEFKLTGTLPGHWTPATPLIRIFGLTRNLSREVNLAQLVAAMGPDAVEKVSYFQPPADLVPAAGVDLSLVKPASVAAYNLARAGVTFLPSDIVARLPAAQKARWASRLSVPPVGERDNPMQERLESNNWTISGRLTATGHPILAGDPHRAQSVPSLRYIAHLDAPGWHVIGAGEPALPGISLGHNDRIAYALTIFSFADEEDLYVYDTNPANSSQYLYQGQWEDMQGIQETVAVRGGPPVTVTLEFTRHGPVLSKDPVNHKAYALRAAYLQHEGTAVYLPSLRVDQARNWDEFTAGMEKHYTPSENMVYADVDGNIGWFGCSIAPIRPNWNGMLPVSGNGDYEWAGYLDTSLLPRILNPPAGYFATANQYNIPDGYPYTDISAHEWSDPYRFDRITEVLGGGQGFTLDDSKRLQFDEVSLPARALVPLLANASSTDPAVQAAIDALRSWNDVLSSDSVAATIFEFWVTQLHRDVFALYVPAASRSTFGLGSRAALLRLLLSPDSAFGVDPIAGRDALVLSSLGTAVAQIAAKLGPDMSTWQWGNLHHMTYVHGLGFTPALSSLLDVGPLPIGGDGYTVHNTGYRLSDFNQNTGSSYREVIDLGDFDRSFTMNSPGQSGDPYSPHYEDLFPLWDTGKFVPMLYSRGAVMSHAVHEYELKPAKNAQ